MLVVAAFNATPGRPASWRGSALNIRSAASGFTLRPVRGIERGGAAGPIGSAAPVACCEESALRAHESRA